MTVREMRHAYAAGNINIPGKYDVFRFDGKNIKKVFHETQL